jgi:hypothetical protein
LYEAGFTEFGFPLLSEVETPNINIFVGAILAVALNKRIIVKLKRAGASPAPTLNENIQGTLSPN